MNVVVKLVEWTAVVGLIWFALFAEVLSENAHRQREEREAQVRDAQRVLARDKAQSALDAAYAKAEQQALAQAETGQGWKMPSREECARAASFGDHDRLDAATVAGFREAFEGIAAALKDEAGR